MYLKTLLAILSVLIQFNAMASIPIQKLAKRFGFQPKNIGYELYHIKSNKIIDKHNNTTAFAPGSTAKVLSGLYVLKTLGANYRTTTELQYTGDIQNSEITGHLILKGGGDPYLHFGDLMKLALELYDKGVRSVRGNFIYDDELFGTTTVIEPEGMLDEGYNGGLSALSVNFNRVFVYPENGVPDVLDIHPQIEFSSTSSKFPSNQKLKGNKKAGKWQYSTHKSYSKKFEIPVRDPSLYTAQIFKYFCDHLGIKIKKPVRAMESFQASVLATHQSMNIERLLSLNFEYSNNLMSELLLTLAASRQSGNKLSPKLANIQLNNWYKQFYSFKPKDLYLINASGLDDENRVTPSAMNKILAQNVTTLLPLLGISGVKGWIKNRFDSEEKLFKVWAKTGTMDYISGVSGYLFSRKKELYAFTIFNNDLVKRREFSNRIYIREVKARPWKNKSHEMENRIINNWLKKKR